MPPMARHRMSTRRHCLHSEHSFVICYESSSGARQLRLICGPSCHIVSLDAIQQDPLESIHVHRRAMSESSSIFRKPRRNRTFVFRNSIFSCSLDAIELSLSRRVYSVVESLQEPSLDTSCMRLSSSSADLASSPCLLSLSENNSSRRTRSLFGMRTCWPDLAFKMLLGPTSLDRRTPNQKLCGP